MQTIPQQVWLPAQFTDFESLPPELRYERWDGVADYPSDPASVAF